ncbi:MAG: ABC transporter substrate-binding protein, partial [Acidimicrobiales bacterium]
MSQVAFVIVGRHLAAISGVSPGAREEIMKRMFRLLSVLLALAMLAAACGGGDSSSESEDGGGGGVNNDAASDAMGSGDSSSSTETTEPFVEPATFEEYEALWETDRQAIIDELNSGDYGVGDDNILRGPGNFEIDLNNCPSDWSDTEGVTDTTVTMALTTALSGNLAAYGYIGQGMQAYFDWVNETQGGIDGKNVELIVKDDAYVAAQTIEMVNELLQADKPFTITTLGSPNTLATYDTLNERCVPQPYVQTGHPAWGDPVNHPWT